MSLFSEINDPTPDLFSALNQEPESREPEGLLGSVIDFLSRGQYASASFFDTLANDGIGAFGSALWNAGSELINPQRRLSFSDLLEEHAPEFSAAHPIAKTILGFVGDVALDPTTYLTFGTSGAVAIGRKGVQKFLTKAGVQELKIAEEAARLGKGISTAVDFAEKAVTHEGSTLVKKGIKSLTPLDQNVPLLEEIKNLGGGALRVEFSASQGKLSKDMIRKMFPGREVDVEFLKPNMFSRSRDAQPVKITFFDKDGAIKPQVADEVFKELSAEPSQLFQSSLKDFKTAPPELKTAFNMVLEPREQAEKAVLDMIAAGRTELVDKGGIKFAGKSLIGGQAFDKMADVLGISKLKGIIKETPVFQRLSKLKDVPEELKELVKGYHATVDNLDKRAIEDSLKRVGGLTDPESLKKVERFAQDVFDESRNAIELLRSMGLKKGEAYQQVLADSNHRIAEMIEKSGLNAKEREAFMGLRQGYLETGQLMQQSGIIDKLAMDYHPGVWETIENAPDYLKMRKVAMGARKGQVSTDFLPAEMRRKIKTFEQARELGLNPDTDALLLYSTRYVQARKKIAQERLKTAAESLFGEKSKTGKTVIPQKYADYLNWAMGESDIPEGLSEGWKMAINGYDKFLSMFKKFATVVKPAFGFKQAISNSLQSFAVLGKGMMNPEAYADAIRLVMYDSPLMHAGSDVAERLAGGHMVSGFGQKYSMGEALEMLRRNNIIRGSDIRGEALRKNLQKEFQKIDFFNKHGGTTTATQGFSKFAYGMAKYMDWPSHVEDVARVSTFLNALRMGHSEKAARDLVTKSLFDYTHGLSKTAQVYGKRLVPFLSYQRFAYPLIAQTLGSTPGRVANIGKLTDAFFDAWNKHESGEQLTASERQVLPGYLLEQPNVLAKFDEKSRAIFRTFNNFNFLDVMGLMETDNNGDVDIERSLIKSGLAQLAPILKMPLEVLMDKNFFTDQAISREKNAQAGRIGDVSFEGVLGNLAGLVGAKMLGIPGVFGGLGVGKATGSVTPEPIKQMVKNMLGWEEAIDTRSGKRNVYINPYLAYGFTQIFPALNAVIRYDKPEFTPSEKMLDLLGGVGTVKTDLQRAYETKRFNQKQEVKELKASIRRALLQGRTDLADERRMQLKELLAIIAEENSGINPGDIRGGLY